MARPVAHTTSCLRLSEPGDQAGSDISHGAQEEGVSGNGWPGGWSWHCGSPLLPRGPEIGSGED